MSNSMLNLLSEINKSDIHCHCFEMKELYYIYDYYYDVVIRVSKEVKECLNYILEGDARYQNYSVALEFLQELISEGLLISQYNNPDFGGNTAYISFAPVYGCNFRCRYCFGQHGESYLGEERVFSEELMKDVLDVFVNKWFPNTMHYRIDFVSGGEPLLNFDIIKKTIEYIEEIQKVQKKDISVWLCTNGSLLNDDICTFLDSHNVSIGISIDGEKANHDLCRVDVEGNGTYDCVVKKIESVLKNKKYSRKFRNVWGLSVVSESNCNILKILNHNTKLGLKNIQMKIVRSANNNIDVTIINNEYRMLCQKIYDEFVIGKFDIIQALSNDNDYFGKILKRILLHQVVDRRCWAGVSKITVCPDGTVYPCDSFVGIQEFCLGRYSEIEQISTPFYNQNVNNRNKCKECAVRYICGGDCYYNSYINNDTINEPSSKFCEIQINIINLCIELKLKMLEYDTDMFQKIKRQLMLKDGYMRQS